MKSEPNLYAYVNGRFLLAANAVVSISDRGFRLGDGVFETIKVVGGVPFQWNVHEHRLMQGLADLRIALIETDLKSTIKKLLHKNKMSHGFVRVAISRGVGSQGYRPAPNITPTIVMETLALPENNPKAAHCYLSKYTKPALSSLPVNSKISHGINSTLALLEAADHGCDEALLLNSQGQLCEAASGNIFWFEDGMLYTPSLDVGCLNGTTRDAIIRISPYRVRMQAGGIEALHHAHAVFLTNCNWGVLPIVSLEPQGWKWTINEIHLEFESLYHKAIEDDVSRNRKDWV